MASVPSAATPQRRVSAFLRNHATEILESATASESLFTRQDILEHLKLGALAKKAAADLHERIADTLLKSDHVVDYGPREGADRVFSSKAMQKLETEMFTNASDMSNSGSAGISAGSLSKVLDAYDRDLEAKSLKHGIDVSSPDYKQSREEQLATVRYMLGSGDLKLLNGPPGAGKTTIVSALVDAYTQEGYTQDHFMATAVAAKAAAGLASDAKVPGQPLNGLISALESGSSPVKPNGIILVDEAGMVDSRQMARLLRSARKHSLKVMLMGDDKQIASTGAGNPFRVFTKQLGAAELSQIKRQRNPEDRMAAMALREGRPAKALASYEKRRILDFTDGKDLTSKTADAYAALRGEADAAPEDSIIVTSDRAAATALNAAARDRLKAMGLLGKDLPADPTTGAPAIAKGERVIFTRNAVVSRKGERQRVSQGTIGTITKIGDDELVFHPDEGKKVRLAKEDASALGHAYALGLRDSQGISVKNVVLAIDKPLDGAEALVAFSRHKAPDGLKAYINRDVYPDTKSMATDFTKRNEKVTTIDMLHHRQAARGR